MTRATTTRDRLLDEAIVLIWRLGYNAVSVDAICEAAGANKGSFYYAFASKADLLTLAIERVWAHNSGDLSAIGAAPGTAWERLERHLDWFLDNQRRLRKQFGFVPGHFHMAIDMNVPEAARAAIAHRAEYRDMLRAILNDVLAEGGTSGDTADWLVDTIGHLISGVMIEARIANSLEPVMILKPTVLRLLDQVSGRIRAGD